MESGSNNPPLVVVVGETASGKSALAHGLAKRFDGEIISADSWAVYKDFDVGTAKPATAELAEVSHHLIDIADPEGGFSAVLFKRLTMDAITDIAMRGKLPILVGGTGLYIDSILFDYGFLPSTSPQLRKELEALSLREVLKRAFDMGLDTEGIDMRNKRRVIRLIENNGARPIKHGLRENTLILGRSIPRDELESRIEQRVGAMLAAGLEDEVKALAARYGWRVEPMKGIGYREFEAYFTGQQNLAETRTQIIHDTLQLAKKQRTWFKRNSRIQWVSDQSEAVDLVTTFLNK